MTIMELPLTGWILLGLPAIINLWAIWHASRHRFPGEREQVLWILAGVFFPVIGGLMYLIFGLRRARAIDRTGR